MKRFLVFVTVAVAGVGVRTAHAQTFPTNDEVLRAIWEEGMERSQTYPLAQALLDSVGPRLTGSPGIEAGNEWLVDRYESWGVRSEERRVGKECRSRWAPYH